MARYTWTQAYAAHYGDRIVTVPNEVANDQRGFAERNQTFPAVLSGGRKVRVRLDAEAYGLFTGGTGDMIVKYAAPRTQDDGSLDAAYTYAMGEVGLIVGPADGGGTVRKHIPSRPASQN